MIKTDTVVGQPHTMDDTRHRAASRPFATGRGASGDDVVEISEECKKRLIMTNLKAALSAADGIKGRYNR